MELFVFFAVFALLWFFQLYGTAKQGQHFMRQVSRLRALGETAIGASSMDRLKRRTYVCLASDETDRVTGAITLDGVTVFARARDVPELVGLELETLARSTDEDRLRRGAAMAAQILLGEEPEIRGSQRVASRWASAMQPSRQRSSGRPSGRTSNHDGERRSRLPRTGSTPEGDGG